MADTKISALTDGGGTTSSVQLAGEVGGVTKRFQVTGITEAQQTLADNTTANVSTSAHGYAPKAPNDATKYLDGTGAYSIPAGGAANPGGSDTQVQFNDGGSAFGGNAAFVFDKTTGKITTTGIQQRAGADVITGTAVSGNAIDVAKALNTHSVTGNVTVTFTGSPTTRQAFGYEVTADSTDRTITLPANVVPLGQSGALASFVVPASSTLIATFIYDGTNYRIVGNPVLTTGSGNYVLSDTPTLVTPVLGTPTSGNLSACTVDGTNLLGYRGAPQNSQSAAYTTVLADAGKCIFHPVGDNNARTFTIDSNANVAYVIGTIIEFINMAATASTIAITTDTLTLLPAGTTGSRTLAQYGRASAEKITSTSWIISGNTALT